MENGKRENLFHLYFHSTIDYILKLTSINPKLIIYNILDDLRLYEPLEL